MFYHRTETDRIGEMERIVSHHFEGELEEIQEVIEQFHQQELEKEVECCGAPVNITVNGTFEMPTRPIKFPEGPLRHHSESNKHFWY